MPFLQQDGTAVNFEDAIMGFQTRLFRWRPFDHIQQHDMGFGFFDKTDKGADAFIGRCVRHVGFDAFGAGLVRQTSLRELCLQFLDQCAELFRRQPCLDALQILIVQSIPIDICAFKVDVIFFEVFPKRFKGFGLLFLKRRLWTKVTA